MAYTTIDNPELYFQVEIYTGTGSSNALTLDGDENMQPDMVWIKHRSGTNNNLITDAVRGTNKLIYPDLTNAENTATTHITAFGSDGFTVATDGVVNESSETYVAWCWKESATAGFDIVSYAGDGGSGTSISHSLSAVPHVMIVKNRSDGTAGWPVYHVSTGNSGCTFLNSTDAFGDYGGGGYLKNPDSSTFETYFTSSGVSVDASGDNYIVYCFTSKQGFSKFGKYSTNNNADGPFIYTGFRPAWLMLKVSAGNTGGWDIYDNKRATGNGIIKRLQANASSTEATSDAVDFLSNGFKIRNTSGNQNGSGDTIIYMAFAEAPFVNSNGVPCNAR